MKATKINFFLDTKHMCVCLNHTVIANFALIENQESFNSTEIIYQIKQNLFLQFLAQL
jgi:hypothetical protein